MRGAGPFRVVRGQQLRETNNYLAHVAEDKQAACVHILQQLEQLVDTPIVGPTDKNDNIWSSRHKWKFKYSSTVIISI